MCGLAGYYNSSELNPNAIGVMIERIKHRGPDASEYFKNENVSLGHCRLKVIDLSDQSNQPFISDDGRYVMLYNGEVYNYRELARKMDYSPKTSGDTEIVLQAYMHYGKSFVNELNGMFAIVIYDTLKNEVLMWRDRFGIKPLYYYWDGKNFAFASELKALYSLPFEKSIDPDSLNLYLKYEYVPQPRTALKNFYKVGHSEYLNFSNGNLHKERYYRIPVTEEPSPKNMEVTMEEFADLFSKSVERRKIADVPLGAFLSGGSDSSAICAALSQSNQVDTFNISFSDAVFDESEYSEKVALELNCNHHSHKMTSSELLESMDKVLASYDDIFFPSSMFPTYKVCELASKKLTVAMSGDGGDELFMGYGYYNWYQRLSGIDNGLGNLLRKGMSMAFANMPSRYARISNLLNYKNFSDSWPHIWSQEQYMYTSAETESLTGYKLKNDPLMESWMKMSDDIEDPFRRISLFDLEHYLPDDLLRKVDIASMAHSLEVRLPFLDHELVEWAVNIPTQFKMKGKEQKIILKKHLSNQISSELVYRKKWGFGAPINRWLKNDLSKELKDELSEESLKQIGIFDTKIVEKMMNKFAGGKEFLGQRLWAVMAFQRWYNIHLKD